MSGYAFTIYCYFMYNEHMREAVRTKDVFIASVSHEIKTPLNALFGSIQLLQHTDLTKEQLDITNKLKLSSGLMLNIVKDILDFSKIKYDQYSLCPESIYLDKFIEGVENMIIPLIQDKGLSFERSYHYPKETVLKVDSTRLSQIIINLVSNSIKFTNYGFIRLFVAVTCESEEDITLTFSVKDTGIGITEYDIPKIFREFEQLENHLTKTHQGTGLGLAICKHLVKAMGGRIWVESEIDVGSEFLFTITVPKEKPSSILNPSAASYSTFNFNKQKLLVVDDTALNYEILQALLVKVNISCDYAADGEEAIKIISNAADDYYKVILMDIQMPKMDGYTTSKILKNKMHLKTPIFALSAIDVEKETIEKYFGILEGFIPKPFKYETLLLTISPFFDNCFVNSQSMEHRNICYNESGQSHSIELQCNYDDRALAISNLGGDEKMYEKHLANFKAKYVHMDALIKENLNSNNMAEAHRLAHSVKGLAGMLGLTDLSDCAGELEQEIELQSKAVPLKLRQFSACLSKTLEE